jgi:hypothetical protein
MSTLYTRKSNSQFRSFRSGISSLRCHREQMIHLVKVAADQTHTSESDIKVMTSQSQSRVDSFRVKSIVLAK